MTFSDLQVYASDLLDDPNNGYFTLSVLKMRLNLGLRELQKKLISANQEWYSTCVKTSTVVNQREYVLPSDFLQIIRLERVLDNQTIPSTQQLYPITPNQRDQIACNSGDPTNYYLQKGSFILQPVPDTVQLIHLEYSYYVADMVNQSDIPDAPQQFHEYIGILATRDFLIKDGRPLAPIESKMGQYEMQLKQIAEQRQADTTRMTVETWGSY